MDSHRRPTNSSQFFYTDRLSDGYFLFRYLHALVAWQAGSRPFSLQRQTANDITTILTLVLMSLLHVTRWMKAQPSSVKEYSKVNRRRQKPRWPNVDKGRTQHHEHIPNYIHAEAPWDYIVTNFAYKKTDNNPMIITFGSISVSWIDMPTSLTGMIEIIPSFWFINQNNTLNLSRNRIFVATQTAEKFCVCMFHIKNQLDM